MLSRLGVPRESIPELAESLLPEGELAALANDLDRQSRFFDETTEYHLAYIDHALRKVDREANLLKAGGLGLTLVSLLFGGVGVTLFGSCLGGGTAFRGYKLDAQLRQMSADVDGLRSQIEAHKALTTALKKEADALRRALEPLKASSDPGETRAVANQCVSVFNALVHLKGLLTNFGAQKQLLNRLRTRDESLRRLLEVRVGFANQAIGQADRLIRQARKDALSLLWIFAGTSPEAKAAEALKDKLKDSLSEVLRDAMQGPRPERADASPS